VGFRGFPLDGKLLRFDRETGANELWTGEQTAHLRQQAPRVLQVAVTNACNKSCSFCYRPIDAASTWTFDELMSLARFADRWGVLELAFGGGEPTVLLRFVDLMRAIWSETGLCPSFTTNGSRLTSALLRALRGSYGQIQLSIYDDDDYLAVIERLVDERARFGLNYLVTPARLPMLEAELWAFCERGVRDSCNNSSDYRLVARFADARTAAKIGAELTRFFAEYAREIDRIIEEDDFTFPSKPPSTAVELGKKYGVKFARPISWGDEGHVGDEPHVAVAGKTLAIYHTYCGGFGEDLPKVLKKAGAKVEDEEREAPDLACTFALPPGKPGEKLAAELVAFLEQGTKYEQICDFEIQPPWGGQRLMYEEGSRVIWASDGKTFGFAMPFDITGFEHLKAYLTKHKAKDVTIQLGDAKARAAIGKLAKASAPKSAATSASAALKLDPKGKSFLFTGKLATMSRAEAKQRITKIGGVTASSVTKNLDFLVVGDDGSPLYGAGTKGEKQLAAEKLIAAGAKLQIISENAFLSLGKK
jgi:hypothetical protein